MLLFMGSLESDTTEWSELMKESFMPFFFFYNLRRVGFQVTIGMGFYVIPDI